MKQILFCLLLITFSSFIHAQSDEIEEKNKAHVRGFYDDLWFSNNTDNYIKYMADTYIAHDIGDRKGVVEPAVEQKNIADFFWENGKIVELWNHRHDIDGPMTRRYTLQGFAVGLLITLIPAILAFRYRRKLKKLSA